MPREINYGKINWDVIEEDDTLITETQEERFKKIKPKKKFDDLTSKSKDGKKKFKPLRKQKEISED